MFLFLKATPVSDDMVTSNTATIVEVVQNLLLNTARSVLSKTMKSTLNMLGNKPFFVMSGFSV